MRMIRSGKFTDKKILLIDREPKTKNDRTWCFWESGESFFESIVYRNWPQVDFLSDTYSATLEIAPYAYKMIRGSDFYQYCITEISRHPQIETIYAEQGFKYQFASWDDGAPASANSSSCGLNTLTRTASIGRRQVNSGASSSVVTIPDKNP